MAEYRVLYWRDLPSQVRVRDGQAVENRALPDRFQQEIDRRAMREGARDEEAYLEGWHWSDWQRREGTVELVLDQVTSELESPGPATATAWGP